MYADAKDLKEGWSLQVDDSKREYKIYIRKTPDGPQVVTEIRADGVTREKMAKWN